MVAYHLFPFGLPVVLTDACFFANNVRLRGTGERKVPEQLIDDGENALAQNMESLGSYLAPPPGPGTKCTSVLYAHCPRS